MITHKAKYRTKDGMADYAFSFEQQTGGNWRVYIDNRPPDGGRDESGPATHRDGSRKYVCWDTPIASLVDAKQVAATWADKTQSYIRLGENFRPERAS